MELNAYAQFSRQARNDQAHCHLEPVENCVYDSNNKIELV